ncbi:unnamed protein product [Amoebophrya sp. A120]|nr:unnamed protein product [Amoebophrya sp. A120]|eukprot:GSA120T00007443001.1
MNLLHLWSSPDNQSAGHFGFFFRGSKTRAIRTSKLLLSANYYTTKHTSSLVALLRLFRKLLKSSRQIRMKTIAAISVLAIAGQAARQVHLHEDADAAKSFLLVDKAAPRATRIPAPRVVGGNARCKGYTPDCEEAFPLNADWKANCDAACGGTTSTTPAASTNIAEAGPPAQAAAEPVFTPCKGSTSEVDGRILYPDCPHAFPRNLWWEASCFFSCKTPCSVEIENCDSDTAFPYDADWKPMCEAVCADESGWTVPREPCSAAFPDVFPGCDAEVRSYQKSWWKKNHCSRKCDVLVEAAHGGSVLCSNVSRVLFPGCNAKVSSRKPPWWKARHCGDYCRVMHDESGGQLDSCAAVFPDLYEGCDERVSRDIPLERQQKQCSENCGIMLHAADHATTHHDFRVQHRRDEADIRDYWCSWYPGAMFAGCKDEKVPAGMSLGATREACLDLCPYCNHVIPWSEDSFLVHRNWGCQATVPADSKNQLEVCKAACEEQQVESNSLLLREGEGQREYHPDPERELANVGGRVGCNALEVDWTCDETVSAGMSFEETKSQCRALCAGNHAESFLLVDKAARATRIPAPRVVGGNAGDVGTTSSTAAEPPIMGGRDAQCSAVDSFMFPGCDAQVSAGMSPSATKNACVARCPKCVDVVTDEEFQGYREFGCWVTVSADVQNPLEHCMAECAEQQKFAGALLGPDESSQQGVHHTAAEPPIMGGRDAQCSAVDSFMFPGCDAQVSAGMSPSETKNACAARCLKCVDVVTDEEFQVYRALHCRATVSTDASNPLAHCLDECALTKTAGATVSALLR